ncbi:hypothetical protein Q7C_1074 [Methylophaga frappieri]|uniref:Uncharacterized protein n=1 Tax=Methylophaga frappieri (strain ATCC BAA-2434 / DSM 25690 / JAM7) TaxID=754477 RepID=I1YH38_METFJ|nr:hypothetical protein Q7C_1074 [Methylophaga frappieri]
MAEVAMGQAWSRILRSNTHFCHLREQVSFKQNASIMNN